MEYSDVTQQSKHMWKEGAWTSWCWDKLRRRWSRVCSGDGLAECSAQLAAIAKRRRLPPSYSVSTRGTMPSAAPIST
jgi:hypothetical protein